MHYSQLVVLIVVLIIGVIFFLQAYYHNNNIHKEGMQEKVKFEFPNLTGRHTISKTMRHVVDTNRHEPFNPPEKRELMVHIWYPSQRSENHSFVVYRQDSLDVTRATLLRKGFREKDLKVLDFIYTRAVVDEQPLDECAPYPVILFSHSHLGSMPDDYTAFCEELASHGYVIASVAHTYYAQQVLFPDGRKISPAPEPYARQTGPNAKEQRMWAEDVQCALDHLMQYNTDAKDTFYNLLDPERVGVMGNEMGGATAFRLCMEDPRFKAGVSLDASPWSSGSKDSELTKPFLFIFAEQTRDDLRASYEELAHKYQVDVAVVREFFSVSQKEVQDAVVISNLRHSGFGDFLLLKDLPIFKNNKHLLDIEAETGTAEGKQTIKLINEHIVNFFGTFL